MSDQKIEEKKEMTFFDHIGELRTRLVYSLLGVGIGAIFSYYFISDIFAILAEPYFDSFPENTLIGTGPAEAFLLRLKASILSSIIITSPYLFYQIWLFIAPGLLENEKKLFIPFVSATTFLFLIGVFFCYFVVLPFTFDFFFKQYKAIGVSPTIRITEHLTLIAKALLGFGAVFQMPILAFFLGRVGILTDKKLIAWFRHAIVVIFVVGAILTPPDVLTQLLMAGPLICLYGISILIVRYTQKVD